MKYSNEYKSALQLAKALKDRDQTLVMIKNLSLNAQNAQKQADKAGTNKDEAFFLGKKHSHMFYLKEQQKNLKTLELKIKKLKKALSKEKK